MLRETLPEHFLWKHEIFQSDLYKAYAETVKAALRAGNSKDLPTVSLLKRAVTEIVEAINPQVGSLRVGTSMEEKLDRHVAQLEQRQSETITKFASITHVMGNAISSALSDHNQGQSSGSRSELPSTASTSDATATAAAQSSGGSTHDWGLGPGVVPTEYEPDNDFKNVLQVWDEFEVGLPGQRPPLRLETLYGAKWRKANTATQRFTRLGPGPWCCANRIRAEIGRAHV